MRAPFPIPLLSAALAALCFVACGDESDRTPASGVVPPAPAPEARSDFDPGEQGISDVARLSRHIFEVMHLHTSSCPLDRSKPEVRYRLAVEVAGGRIDGLEVTQALQETAAGSGAWAPGEVPDWLQAYLTCLDPHLRAASLQPPVADGSYETLYSIGP